MKMDPCPCCSQKAYANCCEPLHLEETTAPTAAALMRSRYAAFALRKINYLVATMDPALRTTFDPEQARQWAESVDFVELQILEHAPSGKTAHVEFKAWFVPHGESERQVHHERSLFRQRDGAWYYCEARTPHHD